MASSWPPRGILVASLWPLSFLLFCCLTGEGGRESLTWLGFTVPHYFLTETVSLCVPAGLDLPLWLRCLDLPAPSLASASAMVGCKTCSITLDHGVALICIFVMAEDVNVFLHLLSVCTFSENYLVSVLVWLLIPLVFSSSRLAYIPDSHLLCEMKSWQPGFPAPCAGDCFFCCAEGFVSCSLTSTVLVSWAAQKAAESVFPSSRFKFSGLTLSHFEFSHRVWYGLKWEVFPP